MPPLPRSGVSQQASLELIHKSWAGRKKVLAISLYTGDQLWTGDNSPEMEKKKNS